MALTASDIHSYGVKIPGLFGMTFFTGAALIKLEPDMGVRQILPDPDFLRSRAEGDECLPGNGVLQKRQMSSGLELIVFIGPVRSLLIPIAGNTGSSLFFGPYQVRNEAETNYDYNPKFEHHLIPA